MLWWICIDGIEREKGTHYGGVGGSWGPVGAYGFVHTFPRLSLFFTCCVVASSSPFSHMLIRVLSFTKNCSCVLVVESFSLTWNEEGRRRREKKKGKLYSPEGLPGRLPLLFLFGSLSLLLLLLSVCVYYNLYKGFLARGRPFLYLFTFFFIFPPPPPRIRAPGACVYSL